MTRADLTGKIQTVLGPIAPEQLGRTLMHEHVLCDIRPPGTRADNDLGPEITLENVWQINYGRGLKRAGRKYMLDLEDIATREVAMMKHDGGDAIVELTCGGLSPDPNGLKRIAAGTGVQPDHGLRLLRQRLPGSEQPRPRRRGLRPGDDRPDPAWRLGHRGARRDDRRDRLLRAVDRHREAGDAGGADCCCRDGRVDQCPSRARSRPAAGGGGLRQGGRPSDRAHRDQPHRPHHLRRGAPAAAGRVRASRSSSTCSARRRVITASPTSTCPTMRRA